MRVWVVGAGMAGAAAARRLADAGAAVEVLDKARGAGGRTAVRREGALRWEHGATHARLVHPSLAPLRDAWADAGLVQRDGDVWRLSPANGPVKALLGDVPVRGGVRVAAVVPDGAGWAAVADDGRRFAGDAVVVAIPAPQAAEVLGAHPFAARLAALRYAPLWVVLRPGGAVDPADAAWSHEHLEDTPAAVVAAMGGEGVAHRWRYARCASPSSDPGWCAGGLAVAGDAFGGGDIDGALISGRSVAERLLGEA